MPLFIKRKINTLIEQSSRDLQWILNKTDRIIHERNHLKSFKNKHENERIYVLGNGPSLKDLNLDSLKNETVITCNGFIKEENPYREITDYYIMEDRFGLTNYKKELLAKSAFKKFLPYDLSNQFFEENQDVVFFNFKRLYLNNYLFNNVLFSKNAERRIYWGGSVAFASLQLAYYMGAKEVILSGVDLSFGDKKQSHFMPNYHKKDALIADADTELIKKALFVAKRSFENSGRKIIDISTQSNIGIFEKSPIGNINKNLAL